MVLKSRSRATSLPERTSSSRAFRKSRRSSAIAFPSPRKYSRGILSSFSHGYLADDSPISPGRLARNDPGQGELLGEGRKRTCGRGNALTGRLQRKVGGPC